MPTLSSSKPKTSYLSLRNKLIFGFSIPIILILSLAILTVQSNNIVTTDFDEIADDITPALLALENLRFAGSSIISSSSEYVLLYSLNVEVDEDESGEEQAQILAGQNLYRTALQSYAEIILEHDPDEVSFSDAIAAEGETLISYSNEIVSLVNTGAEPEAILEAREALEESEISFLGVVDEAIQAELDDLEEGRAEVTDAIAATNNSTFIASILALITAVAVAVYIYRSTMLPLGRLENAAETIRQGRFNVRVPVNTHDEIGQLSETFNTMTAAIEYRDEVQIAKLEQQLTETEAARARAERSDNVKSAFLASMSHELRTPLNAVINFTKFVAQGDLGPVNPEQRDTLFEAVDSAKHLLNLINDVLDMSKIESGSMTLFVQDNINVQEILGSTISTAKTFLKDKPVEIRELIAPDLPAIRGDKQRIRQIVLNILSNACKFTEVGHIEINASSTNGELLIVIKDTGVGIAPEDQDAVFQAFKQSSAGLRQAGGTGLGMPISKNLAEIHGGRLWLESEEGKGASFYLALPVKSEKLIPLAI